MSDSIKRYRLDLRDNGGWGLVPLNVLYTAEAMHDSILNPEPPEWLLVIMAAARVGGHDKSPPGGSSVVVYFTTDQDHNLIAFTDWIGELLV